MTTTSIQVLQSFQPLLLHPGKCFVCFKKSDCPVITLFNFDVKDRVKICADRCLEQYKRMEDNFKKKLEEHKKNQSPKPDRRSSKARAHLSALSIKVFNENDLKIEDIDDFKLDETKKS